MSRRACKVNHRTKFCESSGLISFEVNFGEKKNNNKQFPFMYGIFHIPCHILIGKLNGDGFIANETRIQTTGIVSVSTCRPVYCLRRTCGKCVLDTKVLGNAVTERTTNFGWPAIQQVRDLCIYFLSSPVFVLLPIFFILK